MMTAKCKAIGLFLNILFLTQLILVNTLMAGNPKISAAGDQSFVLKSDGSLWAWGSNTYGQLGDGTTKERHSPKQIGTDSNWARIIAGYHHAIALKKDGTLWAWGRNDYGQLGDGTTETKNSPVQIGIENKWVSVATGGFYTIALKSDGTLWG